MSEPLAVGIAGYGLAGEVFHAPLVAAEPGLRVAGIVTRDPERQARARAAHPGAAIVDDAAKLRDIDLLVVATPNRAHVPLALDGDSSAGSRSSSTSRWRPAPPTPVR